MNHADYGTHVDIWLERISIFNFDFAEYDMDSFHHHVVQGVWTSFTMVRDVIMRIIKVHSNQCRHVEWGSVDSDNPNMIMITRVAQRIADRLHAACVKL